jgi:hypothetical protein
MGLLGLRPPEPEILRKKNFLQSCYIDLVFDEISTNMNIITFIFVEILFMDHGLNTGKNEKMNNFKSRVMFLSYLGLGRSGSYWQDLAVIK